MGTKKGNIPWNKGKKGLQVGWKKGKIGIFKHSPETLEKMSKTRKGKHHTPEWNKKIGLGNAGEKQWNWKGGITVGKNRPMYKKLERQKHQERLAGKPRPDKCEICGTLASELKHGLHFDHDHATGKFRGWLCHGCNTSLGFMKDDIELLLRMVEYLKNSRNP
jgi:hypothetical protein